ncbi:MAG: hypothetical protein ABH859_04715 [Pseudomonadota bacterium]
MSFPAGDNLGPIDQAVRELYSAIENHAPQEQIASLQRDLVQRAGRDGFQLARMLPHFMQAAARNVNATTVYEHFRLPGSNRVVEDNREQPQRAGQRADTKEEAKQEARTRSKEEAKQEAQMEIRKGKLEAAKEKEYENYFADRAGRATAKEGTTEGEKNLEKMLSNFERFILERFEGGKKMAQEAADGKPKFLEKTEEQWRNFFNAFRERLAAKKISLDDVREFFLRGVIMKGEKGVIISDMALKNGQVEKYVRFSVLADILAKLANLKPGDSFRTELLKTMRAELAYLGLATSKGREMATSPLPTAGKFIGGKAEGEAARELGIMPPADQKAEAKQEQQSQVSSKGRRSFLGWLFGEKERQYPEENPYRFVPWWEWGKLPKPAKFSWTLTVFYGALLIMALLGIVLLTYRLLSGS